MKKSTKRYAIGTLAAVGIGYLAGILTAPKSGRDTRQDIKKNAAKTINAAEKELKQLHTQLTDLIGQAKERSSKAKGSAKDDLYSAIDIAKQAKEKARNILSAMHEGDAEDKDLQNAIVETQKAVDHLKLFLSK